MARVQKDDATGCWNWTGSMSPAGYGNFWCSAVAKTNMNASRGAWHVFHGDPGEQYVLHKCDNRRCCRPDHLFLGTPSENMFDASRKGRIGGVLNARAKLDENAVVQIRGLRKEGMSMAKIGSIYGVTWACVQSILSGKTWRRVA